MKRYLAVALSLFAAIFSGCISSHTMQSFTLDAKNNPNRICRSNRLNATIRIDYPRGLDSAMGRRIYYTYGDLRQSYYLYSEWSKPLNRILMKSFIESIDKTKRFANVVDYASTARSDYRLETTIRTFMHHLEKNSSYADISIEMKLLKENGKILKSRLFSYKIPAASNDASGFVHAANTALRRMQNDMSGWLCGH